VYGQGEDPSSKREWRSRLRAARRDVPPAVRAAEAKALVTAMSTVPGNPVCCYVAVRTEPGSPAMLDALAATGRRVLLPVVLGDEALDWADYEGPASLVDGPHGLREPGGPRLGAAAIGLARTILVPALAVDRAGARLGRGAGHYDRSLPLAAPDALVVAVVRDEEVVDALPAEPHDIRMSAVLTPHGGLRALG
jgi:5-formyltetrahydrofolate cyclo-ligase